MVWTNAGARVYHGTSEAAASNISAFGVNPGVGSSATDFGLGFYVTSDLHQAEQWANQKVRTLRGSPSPPPRAAVLTFDLDRDLISKRGDHLTFVLPNSDFHDFVLFNRLGSATHGRFGHPPYDVIYGPVAAFPQTLTYANCDQICFAAVGANNSVAALGSPLSVKFGTPYF